MTISQLIGFSTDSQIFHEMKNGEYPKNLEFSPFFSVPDVIRTRGLPLRSSPQFANRFATKHKETQAFAGFWRVLFLTIPKGFTAKITSFFGL